MLQMVSPRACSLLSSSSLGCLVRLLCPCCICCCFHCGTCLRRVCAERGTAVPSEQVCGISLLLFPSPSLPPSPLGLWCLTQTRAFDTHTHTRTQVKDALLCATSGRQAGGTVFSGARPLSSPPCHPLPQRPTPGEPSPRPWDPNGRESRA